jgi:subtilisin family serine protease
MNPQLIIRGILLLLFLSVNTTIFSQGRPDWIKVGIWKGRQIQYVAGQIAIKVKPGVTKADIAPIIQQIEGKFLEEIDVLRWTTISVPKEADIFKIIEQLQRHPLIEVAEPNLIGGLGLSPNDPYFPYQYALRNTGQQPPGGTNDADIDADEAWNITTGSLDIKIAILDTGIPLTDNGELLHPDLKNSNRIILGDDFVGDGEGVRDRNGHGTHVAGIIGAESNNNVGIAGVAWNCKLLIMQVFDGAGNTTSSFFRNAVRSSVDDGAHILNFSGWVDSSQQSEDALNYVRQNNRVFVTIAGNKNGECGYSNNVVYPGRRSTDFSNIITVSATDYNDSIFWLSSRGPEVNVSAPGVKIFSTLPDSTYDFMSGTSMAAPHVSGVAALILSANPNLTASKVRQIIQQTAEDKGAPGKDDCYGYGRVNAHKALLEVLLDLANANKSTDGGATNPNNVRQIAYGYGGQKLYLVFASGGEIFFRRSTDNGVSWDITKRLSTGDGNNCEPTITVHPYGSSSLTTTDGIHVVWSRRVNGDTFDIYYTKSFDFGQTWSNPVKVVSNVVISSYQFLPWPVIAGVSYQEGVNNLPKGMLPPSYVRALVLVFVDQNGLKWMYSEEPYTYWYGPYSLPSTAPGYFIWYPSVASYSGDSPFLYLTYDARFLHKIYSRFFNVETFSWSDEATVYTGLYSRHSCVSVGMIHSKYAVWMDWDSGIQKWAIGFRAGNFSKDNTWSDWVWRYRDTLNFDFLWYPSVCSYYSGGTYKIAIAGTRQGAKETFILKADASLRSWSISTTGLNSLYAVVPNLNYWSGFAINFKQAMTNQSYPYTIILTDQGLPKLNVDRQFVEIDKIYRRALVFDSWRFEFGDIRLIGKDGEMKIVPLKTFDYSEPVDRSDLWKYLESEDIFNDGRFEKIKISLRISLPDINSDTSHAPVNVPEVNDVLIFSGGEALRNIFSLDELKKGVDLEIPAPKGKIFTVKPLVKFKGYQKEPGDFVAVENYLIDLISYYKASSYSISKSISEPLLEQNYPNPFNPVTLIKFVVPADGHVILRVYDILGREVATLVDEYKKSGSYQVLFDATGLSSGVYFYRLDASGKVVQRKMLLVK